jgi:hypothetical protein
MHARPSAKLIPAANLGSLVSEGAGFAAGEIGQLPSDSDIAAMPDLARPDSDGQAAADSRTLDEASAVRY